VTSSTFYFFDCFNTRNKFYCFGNNEWGQLGLGDRIDRNYPIEFSNEENEKQENENIENNEEQMNKKQKVIENQVESNQIKSNQIRSITCGNGFTFILTNDNKCFSFGRNGDGQLGLGFEERCIESPIELKSPSPNSSIQFIASNKTKFSNWKTLRLLLIAHENNTRSI